MQHFFFCTFLCRCFARLQRETFGNFFMEEMSYEFSSPFFSLPFIFSLHWWPLALSPPLYISMYNYVFHVVLSTKKTSPLLFISRFRSLSPFFPLSFAGLPLFLFFSVVFLLYIPNLCTQLIEA